MLSIFLRVNGGVVLHEKSTLTGIICRNGFTSDEVLMGSLSPK